MLSRPIAVFASLLFAGAASAQPDKPAEKPAEKAAATPAAAPDPAQPSGEPTYEAPDGTKLAVVKKTKITVLIDVEELKLGTGVECTPDAKVTIHYHGTLADGSVFNTSRGKPPVTFPLKQLNVIGWQLGIPGMKAGGIRRLLIPYQLAYGENEVPGPDGKPVVPAKSNLIVAVEVLAINGKDGDGNPYPPRDKAISREERPNGLIIEELKFGEGAECPPKASVVCHYRGVFAVNGEQFDASYDRGQPLEFSLDPDAPPPAMRVIKGWQEGIPGMKIGGKRRLIVPAELGYGAAGSGEISPNSMLEFEVELVSIKN